jgi:hypothetical protein
LQGRCSAPQSVPLFQNRKRYMPQKRGEVKGNVQPLRAFAMQRSGLPVAEVLMRPAGDKPISQQARSADFPVQGK